MSFKDEGSALADVVHDVLGFVPATVFAFAPAAVLAFAPAAGLAFPSAALDFCFPLAALPGAAFVLSVAAFLGGLNALADVLGRGGEADVAWEDVGGGGGVVASPLVVASCVARPAPTKFSFPGEIKVLRTFGFLVGFCKKKRKQNCGMKPSFKD